MWEVSVHARVSFKHCEKQINKERVVLGNTQIPTIETRATTLRPVGTIRILVMVSAVSVVSLTDVDMMESVSESRRRHRGCPSQQSPVSRWTSVSLRTADVLLEPPF